MLLINKYSELKFYVFFQLELIRAFLYRFPQSGTPAGSGNPGGQGGNFADGGDDDDLYS